MTVLVTFASRYGANEGVARTIAEVLTAAGHGVTVTPCDAAPDAWSSTAPCTPARSRPRFGPQRVTSATGTRSGRGRRASRVHSKRKGYPVAEHRSVWPRCVGPAPAAGESVPRVAMSEEAQPR